MNVLPKYLIDKYSGRYTRSTDLIAGAGFQVNHYPDPAGNPLTGVFVSSHDTNWAEAESGDLFGSYSQTQPYIYFGSSSKFALITLMRTLPTYSMSVTWEYWNGAWNALEVQTDTLFNSSGTAQLEFEVPQDWLSRTMWGVVGLYIRGTFNAAAEPLLPTRLMLVNGVETSYGAHPSIQTFMSDYHVEGLRISVELDSLIDWTDWQFALYRDSDLLVLFNSAEAMTNLSFLDTKVSRAQNLSYTVEILNRSTTPATYQVGTLHSLITDVNGDFVDSQFAILPALAPIKPDNFQVEILEHGSPIGKARVSWHVNLNFDQSQLPKGFTLDAVDREGGIIDIFPIPGDLRFRPGQADYTIDVPFNNFLQDADRLSIENVDQFPSGYLGWSTSGDVLTGLAFKRATYILQEAFRFKTSLNDGDKSTASEEWSITTDNRSDLYILVPAEITDPWLPAWLSSYEEMIGHGIILTDTVDDFVPRVFRGTVDARAVSLPGLFGDGSPVIPGVLPYRYIPLLVGNEIQVSPTTWTMQSTDDESNLSPAVTDTVDIKKYFSMVAPTAVISNVVISNNLYSFQVDITIPEYASLDRYVNGFVIISTGGNRFSDGFTKVPSSDNTYQWTETDLPGERVPRYTIKSYIQTSTTEERESVGTELVFDQSLLSTDPEIGTDIGDMDTTRLSAPGIKIQYSGLTLDAWLDYEGNRITNPTLITGGLVLPFDNDPTLTVPNTMYTSYRWDDSGTIRWHIYLPEGVMGAEGWRTMQDYIVTIFSEELATLPQLMKYTFTDPETGNSVFDIYQYDTVSGDILLVADVFRANALIAGGLSAPLDDTVNNAEVLIGNETISGLDVFTSETYQQYGLGAKTLFPGPAIASMPNVQTSNPIDFLGEVWVTSALRVGGVNIPYGRFTDTATIVDLVAEINGVAGYNAQALLQSLLVGGEIVIELDPLVIEAILPLDYETSGNYTLLPARAELFVGYGTLGTMLEGYVKSQYADLIATNYPDDIGLVSAPEGLYAKIVDRSVDGAYLLHASRVIGLYDDNTRIQLLPPRELSSIEPWYPRINVGRIIMNDDDVDRVYSVTEFPMQDWSAQYGAPYKDIKYEKARVLDNFTVQLSNSPLHVAGRNFDFIVDGQRKNEIIEDWDAQNGLLFLNTRVQFGSLVLVSYAFKETSYVYKSLNINPHKRFGNSLLGKYIAFFIVDRDHIQSVDFPVQNVYGSARSIYHRIFDTLAEMNAFAESAPDATQGWPANEVIVQSSGAAIQNFATRPQKPLFLGYYYLNPSSPKDVKIKDARIDGGGLVKAMSYDAAVMKNRFSAGYYDMGNFDGRPFGALVAIVKLPQHVRDRLGEDRVLTEIRAHIPAGTMVLASYYDNIESNFEVVWPLPDGYNQNQALLDLRLAREEAALDDIDAEQAKRDTALDNILSGL